jgi:DNA repair exonuclease SbcCD ATPase subunit
METELMSLDVEQISLQQGNINFPEYKRLKQQAQELAEWISNIEVSAENVKENKKLLAAVNKSVNELETRRKAIKNCMLEPYAAFEQQVKEIVGIVKDADEIVRQQVKALEEQERQEKKVILEDLFNKRIVHYSFRDLFTFDDFLRPKHLNKTASIESVEKEIVSFLTKITEDFKAIETMPEAKDVLSCYLETKDLAAALTLHRRNKQSKERIEQAQAIQAPTAKIAYLVGVHCENDKELKFIEMLLNENGFIYTVDKILGGF